MTQNPAAATPTEKSKSVNWIRLFRVWLALFGAMMSVALFCWAAMPRERPPMVPTFGTPAGSTALAAIVWPDSMAPSRPWHYIVIHHSATTGGTLESIDQGHRVRGFEGGVGYHFLINNGRSPGSADGQIVPTPRWLDQLDGAHTKVAGHPEFNTDGIGICLIGNFDEHQPTAAQMASLEMLVQALRTRYDVPLEQIVGHGELKNTHCPGRLFPMQDFLMDLRQVYLKSRLEAETSGPPAPE